jgi:16S rRNA (cytidine1402-2'-O)-methyltransferase
MSTFYIVATPIGNLQDISSRAIEALKGVDLILAEDTRVTSKLLTRYQIKTRISSYHQHSKLEKIDYILQLLGQGKNLVLVSDAGTPGISDPGNQLVEKVVECLGDKVNIVPIPGPSALAAAASVCGFPMDRFLFLGFPPAKNKRQKFFKEVLESKYPVILYESSHRILKTIEEINILASNFQLPNSKIVACQELTKMFEKTYRGTISEVLDKMKDQDLRGEFVVIIDNRQK